MDPEAQASLSPVEPLPPESPDWPRWVGVHPCAAKKTMLSLEGERVLVQGCSAEAGHVRSHCEPEQGTLFASLGDALEGRKK